MLVRGFLSQNVVIGCSYGTFGISMIGLQERYDAGRGVISLGFSLVILGMGLLGPLISRSVERFGFRRTMMVGAVLAGSGYALLATSSHIVAFFIAFGLLIGPGVAMAGTLPVGLLVGGWFPEWRGRAVGLATMPVLLSFLPMVGVGLAWASIMGNPYVLLAGSIPAERAGVYMGIFNMFITAPMLLFAFTVGFFYEPVLGGDARNIITMSGVCLILAAIAVYRIKEGRATTEVIASAS